MPAFRDIFVAIAVFVSLPIIVLKPWVGIYMWSWLGYMNPHRISWGFARDMPFAMLVALATLIGTLIMKESRRIPLTREVVLLLLFILWMLLTTVFSLQPTESWIQMEKVTKIQLMTFLTLMLINNRKRLETLVWVIVLSLGFYGVKGGIFTITTGGNYHVYGPLGTFIGGNNEIGLALIMIVPLMRYLQLQATNPWIRRGFTIAILLTAIAIVGSQSRGALVGLCVMGAMFWFKSRKKFYTALMVTIATVLILALMPGQWFDRMGTIRTYEEDGSAQGRINSWMFAINLAKDRPLGGGFESFNPVLMSIYAPNPDRANDAHSIYFEVLGEHGFAGLALFLALGFSAWRRAGRTMRAVRGDPERQWASDLAAMAQASLVGYASAGAFLGLAYFDLYYHLVSIIVLTFAIAIPERPERALTGQSRRAATPESPGYAPRDGGALRPQQPSAFRVTKRWVP